MRGIITILFFMLIFSGVASAQTGEDIFYTKCAGCHKIGGGDLSGPDLQGVTDRRDIQWIKTIITNPDKLVQENDPTMMELIARYGFQMPNLGVSDEEADKIIEYLKGFSAGAPRETPVEKQPAEQPSAPAVEGDPISGKMYFTGEKRFSAGGPPCISCHSARGAGIQGGTLAPDLSDLYGKLGEKGLRGVLQTLQFPVMKDVYKNKKLSEEEIADMIAFFKETGSKAQKKQVKSGGMYPISGVMLFLVAMGIIWLYSRRVK